jgi:hypothetical protein
VKPYFEEDGITIYLGDCREVLPLIKQPPVCVTDPVWPNSVFPGVTDPQQLFAETCEHLAVETLVVHLGCTSDPRFLGAVPKRYPFVRAQHSPQPNILDIHPLASKSKSAIAKSLLIA